MAPPLNHVNDRQPTPPLSPSTSSGSSHASSTSSTSPSPLSSILQRDGASLRATCPDSQPLERHNRISKLGLVADGFEEDAMMIDDWGEEGHERPDGLHASQSSDRSLGIASVETPAELVSIPFQLESTRTQLEEAQSPQGFNSGPSTDVIDGANLARQEQIPPAYENVDEPLQSNGSRLTTRAARPLPIPPLDRHNSSTSIHSTSPATGAATPDPHETAEFSPQPPSSILSTSRPFPSKGNTLQPPVGSLGRLHSQDSSPSQDWVNRSSTGVLPLPTSAPFNVLPHHNPHTTLAATFSSRPTSSPGLIQAHPLPLPYSPPMASSSRNSGRPFSEHAPDMRSTHQPPPAAPASASRGLPPPAPPTILDPPPARSNSARSYRPPYEPFLSDAPPPPDSWITVETSQAEYRLNARLPGFRRDAITLAARRRRVLHVMADSWEPGGGHFERRISFGYDADLSQVRAEFDGEILRVIVPRRTPALTWYGGACE